MSTNFDNKLILSAIKLHYGFSSDAELARFLGVKPQTISTWNARNSFDKDLVYAKCDGIDANFLYTGQGDPWPKSNTQIINLPVTSSLGMPKVVAINESNEDLISLVNAKAAAGYLNGYSDPEYIEKLPTISMPGLRGGTHRAFEIQGHSMSPTLHNKSIGIGRWVEDIDEIKDRYVYAVVTKSEGIVIKRVLNRAQERGQIILLSDNQHKREYPNIIVNTDDVIELWRLRAAFSFEFPEPTIWQDRFNDFESQLTLIAEQVKIHSNQINAINHNSK